VSAAAEPPAPLVLWTVPAHRHLRQSLAEAVSRRGTGALEAIMSDLTDRLKRLFPRAAAVVVQAQYTGFRRREDEFILLVEVGGSDRSGRHVVKLASESRLQAELLAWESCRPHGLRHDIVLMTLEPCRRDGELLGLIYEDAQQFLGDVPARSLEQAFLGAVLHGTPSPASVAEAIDQLYERLGHLLYSTWFVDNPADADFILDVPHLEESLAVWARADDPQGRSRQDVNTWASPERGRFRDPVDFLHFVCRHVPWRRDPTGCTAAGEVSRPAAGPTPARADLVPRMLRGCSHGDLHARNVLVAVLRDRARWPAVFDYEHMARCNLLAWDFVKMETELKIRAYPALFGTERAGPFVRSVQDFEEALAQRTEACYDGAHWPAVDDRSERPADRLRGLLLTLRQQAALHLGGDRGRPREWLAEYYFALACYGVSTGRFATLTRPELLGAYVSAGLSAARFLWASEDRLEGAPVEERP
jgi:hypothetical protein